MGEKSECKEEGVSNTDPCSVIHNGSPAGESPMGNMQQCDAKTDKEKVTPFMLDPLPDGQCQGDSFAADGGSTCFAPWVYCTDAACGEPEDKDGVLIAKCLCWMPEK